MLTRSLGPVSSSHSLFRPPLVILTGIINAATSRASASFPPTQQSVSLEMRRRAWRKSGRLISPPTIHHHHHHPPAPNPPNSPSTPTFACCLYAALVVRQQFTEWTSNNTGSLAFMSLLAALFVCPSPLFSRKKEPVLVGQSQPFSPGPEPRVFFFSPY